MTPGAMAETDQARAAAAAVLDELTKRARAASADGLPDLEVWVVLLLAALDSPVSRDRMAIAMAEAVMRLAGVGQTERIAPVDLDALDAELDQVRAVVDHAEAQYNPFALRAVRVAEQLRGEVDRVEALRTELAAELERERDHSDAALQRAAVDMAQTTIERDRLERQLATARQALGDIASLAATAAPVDDPTGTLDRLGEIVRLAQAGSRTVPGSPEPA